MLKAKDFRQTAWTKLKGKWGTMAVVTLIYALITGAMAGLAFFYIGGIAAIFLTGAFTLGLAMMALNVAREKEVQAEQLFGGFKNYVPALALSLLVAIFTMLWTLLFIIPGIIKAYSYSMSFYILADDPRIPANEARKRSMAMMKGNKWRLFCLDISFIGWYLLSILTLGILLLWITPYAQAARAEFYRSLLPAEGKVVPSEFPEQPAGGETPTSKNIE